jgi:RimJ/RimL family protein N-acetyltransferase
MNPSNNSVSIRPTQPADLEVFFEFESDEGARYMAAFVGSAPERGAYLERWQRILADSNNVVRTIEVDGKVAGNVLKFTMFGEPTVAYWVAREYWGRGVATQALSLLLAEFPERPLYARAAKDNTGSRRVLEKCGFVVIAEETNVAELRGGPTEEVVMKLE